MDKSKIATGTFNKYAQEYQAKFMDTSMYHESFNLFCKCVNQDASVLDLACGPGNIAKYLLDQRPDLRITGIDLAPNMIRLAKANNPSASFIKMDCRKINQLDQKFDAVMCGFCLPYLSMQEMESLVTAVKDKLPPGGAFYVSTMEDDYSNSGYRKGSYGDEIFMHYFREHDIAFAMKKNNFIISDISRVVSGEGDAEVTDLIILALKQ